MKKLGLKRIVIYPSVREGKVPYPSLGNHLRSQLGREPLSHTRTVSSWPRFPQFLSRK